MKTWRKLSQCVFMLNLMQGGKITTEERVWGKQHRNLSKAVIWSPLRVPLSSDRDVPFLLAYRGHKSLTRFFYDLFYFFMTCFREVQNILPAHAISQVPSALNVQYVKVPYFGVHVMNSIAIIIISLHRST